ncbi:MAG: hypothetical protein QM651_15965 [Rhodoblastus sp.]
MWRILVVTHGSLAQVARVLEFFGVDPRDIFAPYIVRCVPNLRRHAICEKVGRRRRYVQPMREHKGAMFPGYLFVRCDGPVQCASVDWAARGRGALLRTSADAEPSAISGAWVEALRDLCAPDDKGRMCIGARAITEEWRGDAHADPLRKVVASGAWARVRMVCGPFADLHAEIEPVVDPEAVADVVRELDESGRLRVCFLLFGSWRSVVVPREQVEVLGDSLPKDASVDYGARAQGPAARPPRTVAKRAAG